jgi:hypothetical protein
MWIDGPDVVIGAIALGHIKGIGVVPALSSKRDRKVLTGSGFSSAIIATTPLDRPCRRETRPVERRRSFLIDRFTQPDDQFFSITSRRTTAPSRNQVQGARFGGARRRQNIVRGSLYPDRSNADQAPKAKKSSIA